MPCPGWQFADGLAGGVFRAGADLVRQGFDVVQTVTVAQRVETLRGYHAAGNLRPEVTQQGIGRADVPGQDVEQGLVGLARLVQLQDRYPQAFLMDVAGTGADAISADRKS